MHAARSDGSNRRPGRIVVDLCGEVSVDGDDDVGIPHQHLLDRDVGEAAAGCAGDVPRQEFDGLDRDRAAQSGLEAARSARKIDARPLLLGDAGDPAA